MSAQATERSSVNYEYKNVWCVWDLEEIRDRMELTPVIVEQRTTPGSVGERNHGKS